VRPTLRSEVYSLHNRCAIARSQGERAPASLRSKLRGWPHETVRAAKGTHYTIAARLHVRRASERQRACVVSYADGHTRRFAQRRGLTPLPLRGRPFTPQVAPSAHAPARENHSELRLLLHRPAYPKLGYRQRLTTWKKNGQRAARRGVAKQTVLTTVSYSLTLARNLCSSSERRVLARGPQGRAVKPGVSPGPLPVPSWRALANGPF